MRDFLNSWLDYIYSDQINEARIPASKPTKAKVVGRDNESPSTSSQLSSSKSLVSGYIDSYVNSIVSALRSQEKIKKSPALISLFTINNELLKLTTKLQPHFEQYRKEYNSLFEPSQPIDPEESRKELTQQIEFVEDFFNLIMEELVGIVNKKVPINLTVENIGITNESDTSEFNQAEFHDPNEDIYSPIEGSHIKATLKSPKIKNPIILSYPLENLIRFMNNETNRFELHSIKTKLGGISADANNDIKRVQWLMYNTRHPSQDWDTLYNRAFKIFSES